MNKYHPIALALGTIADYIREKGATPVERDYHSVLRAFLKLSEEQSQEQERLTSRIAELERQVQTLRNKH